MSVNNLPSSKGRSQENRGCSRPVVAVNPYGVATYFSSVRQCAKYLRRNPASVTKVCQGVWSTCADHEVFYEEDFGGEIKRKYGKGDKFDW
jgi:hypothetical protein